MKKKLKKAQNGMEAAPKPIYKQQSFLDSPLQLNWSHVLASQVLQGIGTAASNNNSNSFENATLRYNQSISPTSWLPNNPNTSLQALYGMKKGGIHIKPSHKGRFTAWAKSHGMSVSEAASHVMANKDKYDHHVVAMANFAKNFGHKKADGGIIDAYIRNFIYGDAMDETKPKQDTPKSKKKINTSNVVADDQVMDIQDMEEQPTQRMSSANRIAMLLGNYSNQTSSNNTNGVTLDPNVVSAEQELLSKFPNLKVTSAIRNWGDKDAHPKGRAIDLAGPDLNAAYEYYKNTIVPKYGFNPALPLNHGTGPHIHLGYYQQGGRTPIITDNPNDPRLRAYQDSLQLSNSTSGMIGRLKELESNFTKDEVGNQWYNFTTEWNKRYGKSIEKAWNRLDKLNGQPPHGTEYWSSKAVGNQAVEYKKPVQPVIYKKPEPTHPYTKSVAKDNSLPTVNNTFGAPNPINVGGPQGKSNYAFQYRDENGNQQVIYFPNSTKMAEFAKDQPWSSKSSGKDWWTINAPYLKKQLGGDFDTNAGLKKVDPRMIAMAQSASKPNTQVRLPGDSLTNKQLPNAVLQAIHNNTLNPNGFIGGWKIDPNKLGNLQLSSNEFYTPSEKDLKKMNKYLSDNYPLGITHDFWGTLGATHYIPTKQEGGLINETGYTEGSPTENNPMNIIPSGNITMANVYSPVVAVPHKNGKPGQPVVMHPENDYTFDADYTMEFKAGGTYDLTPAHIEYLRKLGYEVEEIS